MNLSSWKTTITGLVSAGASFVMFSQQLNMIQYPKWALAVAMFAAVGGLASFGIMAKDYNATGGTVPTTGEAVKRVATDPTGK